MICERVGNPGLCPFPLSLGGSCLAQSGCPQFIAAKDFGEERATSQTESDSLELNQTSKARFGTETPRASLQAVTRDLVTEVENGPEEVISIYAEGSHLRSSTALGEGTDLSLLKAFGNLVLCTVERKSPCNSSSLPRQNQDI